MVVIARLSKDKCDLTSMASVANLHLCSGGAPVDRYCLRRSALHRPYNTGRGVPRPCPVGLFSRPGFSTFRIRRNAGKEKE
jgi:hypothetical protein